MDRLEYAFREIARVAGTIPTIRRIFAYGSRIKGGSSPASDLDLAVEMFGDDAGERLAAFISDAKSDGQWDTISGQLGIDLDLKLFDADQPGIAKAAALEHGVVIFQR